MQFQWGLLVPLPQPALSPTLGGVPQRNTPVSSLQTSSLSAIHTLNIDQTLILHILLVGKPLWFNFQKYTLKSYYLYLLVYGIW